MNAEQFFNNGFGADVEKVHRKHVIDLMTNFAKHYHALHLQQIGVSKRHLLESILEDLDGKHSEYHREVVESYLYDGC